MAEGDRRPDGGASFPRTSPDKFGSCCEEMREAIDGDGFEPLITVGADGMNGPREPSRSLPEHGN